MATSTSASPDHTADADEFWMEATFALAELGWGQTAPNPLVGAVVRSGDAIVGEGHHARFGESHAEVMALQQAGDSARGATLYVNLEPCNHTGKTPPCTEAIIASGIARVVIAARDPNPSAAGGAERLRAAGVAVEIGTNERQARELNAAFFNSFVSDRPWVTLKLAVSLDGAISSAARTTRWLTNDLSRRLVHRMRAGSDAIAVGAATAAADDPQLTVRFDPRPRIQPTRIVFDRSARLSAESTLARTAREVPTLIVTSETTHFPADLQNLGVEALPAHNVRDALVQLKSRGFNSLMVEGGAGLAASFLGGGFVDRLAMFQSPVILGQGSLNAFSGIAAQEADEAPSFHVIETVQLNDDILTIYSARGK